MKRFKTAGVYISDALIFLLGTYGVTVFIGLQGLIAKCNPFLFAAVCMIVVYIIISIIKKRIM